MSGDCAECSHSAAYHDGNGGRPCHAWNPDEDDNYCACKGWVKPKREPELVSVDAAGTEWWLP